MPIRQTAGTDRTAPISWRHRAGPVPSGARSRLGRSASTVSREQRRNAHPADGGYRPHRADQLAASRRPRPKRRKIRPGPDLYAYVAAGLKRHWSPERISNRLGREYPDHDHMRACHETIYQAVYVQPRGGLRRQVGNALRRGRAVRRSRSDGQSRRPRFREPMVMISEAVYVQPRGGLRRQVGNALRRGRAVRRSRSDGQSRRPRFREPMVMISERPAQIEDRAANCAGRSATPSGRGAQSGAPAATASRAGRASASRWS